MSKYRRSRDGNEIALVDALEAIPWPPGSQTPMPRVTVQPIEGAGARKTSSLPGAGTPDLLVGLESRTVLMEVKNPASSQFTSTYVREPDRAPFHAAILRLRLKFSPDRLHRLLRKIRRSQLEWWTAWNGAPVHLVTTAREAAAALGLCLVCGADNTTGLCDEHAAEETTT